MGTILKLNVMEDAQLRADVRKLFTDVAKSVTREEIAGVVETESARIIATAEKKVLYDVTSRLQVFNVEAIVRSEVKKSIDTYMSVIALEARIQVKQYINSPEVLAMVKQTAIDTTATVMRDFIKTVAEE